LKIQGLFNKIVTPRRGSEIQRRMTPRCTMDPAVGAVHGFTVDPAS
jgi:hypothetical protein